MNREKDSHLLSYTFTPSLVLWTSYYTYNIIRDVNLWFSKCGWKENLLCEIQVVITYWLKKRIRKFTFLKYTFFWKSTVTVTPKKFSSKTIWRWYTFGKFYISRFNYFSGTRNKVKEKFWNIIDWPLCWWYWE